MDVTDVSPAALVNAIAQMRVSEQVQTAQLLVLKKALEAEASGALTLLQALPASLPLATSGTLGTQLNVLA